MQLFRRLIAWSCFLGLLAADGVGVFHWVRYRPRCTVEGPQWVLHVSRDGRWAVTRKPDTAEKDKRAVVEVWDTNTGRAARSFVTGVHITKSPDARYFASCQDGVLQLIDWQSGTSWVVPGTLSRDSKYAPCMFSPRGTWLCVRSADEPPRYFIVERATRKVVHRLVESFVGFSNDDRHVICWTPEKNLRVLDVPTGEEPGTLALDKEFKADELVASIGKRTLVVGEYKNSMQLSARVFSTAYDRFEVWDLNSLHRKWPNAGLAARKWPERRRTAFANDGRFLAGWTEEEREIRLEVIDLEAGKTCIKHSAECQNARRLPGQSEPYAIATFSPDDQLFLFYLNREKCMMFDVASGELLWAKPYGATTFIGASTVIWHDEKANRYEELDARTGFTQHVLASGLRAQPCEPELTPDGRCFVLGGTWQTESRQSPWTKWLRRVFPAMMEANQAGVIVSETTTGRELLRLHLKQLDQLLLSDDGSTLVTTFGDSRLAMSAANCGFQVWNVHPHRAYFWAFTWPLLIGSVLLLLRRWRANRKPAAASRTVSVTREGPVS